MGTNQKKQESTTQDQTRRSKRLARKTTNSRYWTDEDLAERWNVCRDTIWRWARVGHIPAPIKLPGNCTRWLRDEVESCEESWGQH
jgi:predicted DNA-binding transcriptional regulator AlpA